MLASRGIHYSPSSELVNAGNTVAKIHACIKAVSTFSTYLALAMPKRRMRAMWSKLGVVLQATKNRNKPGFLIQLKFAENLEVVNTAQRVEFYADIRRIREGDLAEVLVLQTDAEMLVDVELTTEAEHQVGLASTRGCDDTRYKSSISHRGGVINFSVCQTQLAEHVKHIVDREGADGGNLEGRGLQFLRSTCSTCHGGNGRIPNDGVIRFHAHVLAEVVAATKDDCIGIWGVSAAKLTRGIAVANLTQIDGDISTFIGRKYWSSSESRQQYGNSNFFHGYPLWLSYGYLRAANSGTRYPPSQG